MVDGDRTSASDVVSPLAKGRTPGSPARPSGLIKIIGYASGHNDDVQNGG
jgi:hypothetical protein